MSWFADDFIQPRGQLNPAWYPEQDLTTLTAAWLAEAEGKTDVVDAQEAWVYYRAFRQLADDFHAGVAISRQGEVSGTRSEVQFKYWSGRAARELARYRNLIGGVEVVF